MHLRFAIVLFPKEYHRRIIEDQGGESYLRIVNDKEIIKLNHQIYNYAKINEEDINGKKSNIEKTIK